MDLVNYIGETSSYDKKVQLERHKPKSWLKSVSAFANSKGGVLIWGIDDEDRLVGLDDAKGDSEFISAMIKTKLDPTPRVNLEIIRNDNKDLIMLQVYEGNETPYYYVDSGNRLAFIRVGNESVAASSVQLNSLILRGMNKTFDTISTTISIERAAFSKLKSVYFQRTGNDLRDNDLLSFRLVSSDHHLTNAGALLADEPLVRQSRVFATRWNGLDKTNGREEALDDKEFEGSLLLLLQNSIDFVKTNSKKRWKKVDTYRVEYPDYPERAIQEVLVNALIHRDYGELGSEVHIDMYDDRLEIYSPGGMMDGTFIQELNLSNISSKRRNPMIADVFSRMHLMERRGSGLKKVLDIYESQEEYDASLRPEFRSTQSSFFAVLKNLNYEYDKRTAVKNGDKGAINPGSKGNGSDSGDIRPAIKNNENGDKGAINPDIKGNASESGDIRPAVKNNINGGKEPIKGGTKGNSVNSGNARTAVKVAQKQQILTFAEEQGVFKAKEIAELLDLKASRTRYLLLELVKEGKISIIGTFRNRKYQLIK